MNLLTHSTFKNLKPGMLGLMCVAICVMGCRAPWQVNTPREMEVGRLLNEEREQSRQDDSTRPSRSLANRLRSRGGAPSPTRRKTNKNFSRSDSPQVNPIEEVLTKSGLLGRQQSRNQPESDALERYEEQAREDREFQVQAAKDRIQQEIERRAKLRNADPEDEASTGIRMRMSDSEGMPPANDLGVEIDSPASLELDRKPLERRTAKADASKSRSTGEGPTDVRSAELRVADIRKERPVSSVSLEETPGKPGAQVTMALGKAEVGKLGQELLAHLQAQASKAVPQDRIELEKKMRLVQMALGDLESAQEPIEGLEKPTQEYISQTLKGLHEATRQDGNPSTGRKMTKALHSHREATQILASVASLEVNNCAFCTEIDGFGDVKPFSKYRFRADQQVLLYCELENFVSEKTASGFCTKLQGNYEIIDRDGNRVIEQVLPEDTDICAQKRRDFYIAYRFHLPKKIAPGAYQLRLVIEDIQGHKFGNAELDFDIVE